MYLVLLLYNYMSFLKDVKVLYSEISEKVQKSQITVMEHRLYR
jgi:DNA-binding transcriptional ArsR family regulator